MPVYACKHPTCAAFVPKPGSYCQSHAEEGRDAKREARRFYDQHLRDADAKAFYNSVDWQRARKKKLAANPCCERCEAEGRATFAEHVHHRKKLADCTPAERLDQRLLMSVCPPCHNKEEAEITAAT